MTGKVNHSPKNVHVSSKLVNEYKPQRPVVKNQNIWYCHFPYILQIFLLILYYII